MTAPIQLRRGKPMQRISLPWMLEVADSLDKLDDIVGGDKISDQVLQLYPPFHQLEQLFLNSIYSPYLRASRQKADELYAELKKIFDGINEDSDRVLTESSVAQIQWKRDEFRLVFLSEISTLPVFLVQPKAGYDIPVLIEMGTQLFPLSLLTKAPEAESDAMEAARALAFELGTACGFHVFRLMESVVKRYWDEVTKKTRPKLETLGTFAAELEKGKHGDQKIVEAMKQMTKLHRNPIIHPEVILTVEEAIGIIGMARSVVSPMLNVLPDVPPTTGAP